MSDKATHVFGAQHAEIASITTEDPITQTITYGTAIDVPGLKNVTVNVSSDSKELRGDNTLLAKETVVQNIEVVLEFAKWDATVFAAITGSTITDTTDGYSVAVNANNNPGTFSLRALSASTSESGKQAEIYFPKLKIANIPDMLGLVEEDFKTVSVTCEVIPTYSGDWMVFNYGDAIGGGGTTPPVIQVEVPDVLGLDEATATSTIEAAGLVASTALTVTTEPLSWGTVVFTDPAVGTLVDAGSTVVLIIAVETLPGA
jgi:hypothetical protein